MTRPERPPGRVTPETSGSSSAGVVSAPSNLSPVPATANVVTANVETLKVSTTSNPNSVAGAIAGAIRTSGAVWIQVVGAGALNQATKASVIARGILSASGLDIVVTPSFADIEIDGEARTALRLRLEDRERRQVSLGDGDRRPRVPPADVAVG